MICHLLDTRYPLAVEEKHPYNACILVFLARITIPVFHFCTISNYTAGYISSKPRFSNYLCTLYRYIPICIRYIHRKDCTDDDMKGVLISFSHVIASCASAVCSPRKPGGLIFFLFPFLTFDIMFSTTRTLLGVHGKVI